MHQTCRKGCKHFLKTISIQTLHHAQPIRSNLIGEKAVSVVPEVVDCFRIVQELFDFF